MQCVGLSEKPGRFAHGDSASQNNDDTEAEELAKLIAQENDRVAKAKDRSAVTIVVATMLSSAERVKRDLSAGVNELRGAYLAQRDRNQLDGIGRNPLVRLVLANLGGEFGHAVDIAQRICEYALRDPSVVAVTGLGQGRETTQNAIAELGPSKERPNGISMVGSTLSSTNFSQKPHFFRVAPGNDRQAQVAARMIERTGGLRGRPAGDDLMQPKTTNFTNLEDIKQYVDGRLYLTTFAWA